MSHHPAVPERMRRNLPAGDRCPCQQGRCGRCRTGQHAMCTFRGTWRPNRSPETYVLDRDGYVVAFNPPVPSVHGGYIQAVLWRADGTACRWECSCRCWREPALLGPFPQTAPPRRRNLVGGNQGSGGIPAEDPQLSLFNDTEVVARGS